MAIVSRKFVARVWGILFLLSWGGIGELAAQDPATLAFTKATYFAAENGQGVIVTVRRTGNPSGTASAQFAVTNGSATAGLDYQATNGVLVLAPGEIETSFEVIIMDDLVREGDETAVVTLTDPAEGTVLGSLALARIIILDNEGPGSLDPTFDANPGPDDSVSVLLPQPDARIVVAGFFRVINERSRNGIARLNPDGSLDPSFDPGTGADYFIQRVALQPDGKLIVVGAFTNFNGHTVGRVARLMPDGRLDPDFNTGTGANDWVDAVALLPSGEVLIGGRFTQFNGVPRNRLVRLKPDGSLDAAFQADIGPNTVARILVLDSGSILISGNFESVNGVAQQRIARLDPEGALDASFHPPSDSGRMIAAMALQADGKILVGGDFIRLGGTRNFVARLAGDGSLDESFAANPNDKVDDLLIESTGKIVVVGEFNRVDGFARNGIARLSGDGSLDFGFDPGAGANGRVLTLAQQPDQRILIGGRFFLFNHTPRSRVARLYGDDPPPVFLPPSRANGNLGFHLLSGTATRIVVETSIDSRNWLPLSTHEPAEGTLELSVDPTADPVRFYRARSAPLP